LETLAVAEPKPLRTLFTYPWDLDDDGLERALDVIQEDGRLNGVSLAVAYHVATYFLPHNPRRKIWAGDDGMVLFVPQGPAWARTKLRPQVGRLVQGKDWLPRIVEAIKKRGLHFTAWTVYFYNHYLARTFPEAARRDALGNVHPAQLCPANPDVRAYALALTEDVARFRPDAFYLESLSYLPFGYGFSNAKVLTPLTPRAEFLLGLCFCEHCLRAAGKGLNAARFQATVASWLEDKLPRMPTEADRVSVDDEWLDTAFDSRLQHFLAARAEVATSLYEDVVRTIRTHGDVRVESDLATQAGMPRSGLVPRRVNGVTDRLGVGVPVGPDAVKAARQEVAADRVLLANIQPAHLGSEADAERTVRQVRAAGVDGFTFYNYGLIRLEQLHWIGKALAAE
jgi:hypothetical protein